MKKAIILSMVFAMAMGAFPAVAVTTGSITTGLTPDTSGGTAPVVQAKWEANIDRVTDDATTAGAQFLPSGQYQINKTISICEIVSDPDGISDVNHVYADVFYPTGIAVGTSHDKLESQTGSEGAGCGLLMQEDELTALTKDEGIDLFCNQVRTNNTNLPTFKSGYTYDTICKADGTLHEEMAKVYCVTKELSYEDPSGSYEVKAVVVDKTGKNNVLSNHFSYLPFTAFETDFTSVSYGKVRLETEKMINGDLTWGTPTLPTVRNVGNTRLAMTVSQDDMNFGKTGILWNVWYKARVGNQSIDWQQYDPNQSVTLGDQLDLSELDKMDFNIFAKKFPITEGSYSGTMTLGAVAVDHLCCNTDGTGFRCVQN